MNHPIKKSTRVALYLLFVLAACSVKAQNPVIDGIITQLNSHKNFSYQAYEKLKDYTNDTLIRPNYELFMKATDDKMFGYYFSIENRWTGENFVSKGLYDGQKLVYLHPADSTYTIQKPRIETMIKTLPGNLDQIRSFLQKNPSKIRQAADTTINGRVNQHWVVSTRDTVIDKEHLHTLKHLFVDQATGLPNVLLTTGRNKNFGTINTYYSKITYSNYKFDQSDVSVNSFTVPPRFHPPLPAAEVRSSSLAKGSIAPQWTLEGIDGKKTSLSQLKGKIVLLDFYFIGCTGCMESLQPLNELYKKYKDKGVVIASLAYRDSKKAVAEFDKQYGIKYSSYVGAADVVKTYKVEAFPTFYIIDQQGKIANAISGYNEDFTKTITATFDALLGK